MSLAQQILPEVFLWFGYFCMAAIVYLAITWILGIKTTRHKSKEEHITEIKSELTTLTRKAKELKKQLEEAEEDEQPTKNE
jgi:uncharacterized membrane protein YkvA (DUF1232 family)